MTWLMHTKAKTFQPMLSKYSVREYNAESTVHREQLSVEKQPVSDNLVWALMSQQNVWWL